MDRALNSLPIVILVPSYSSLGPATTKTLQQDGENAPSWRPARPRQGTPTGADSRPAHTGRSRFVRRSHVLHLTLKVLPSP